MVALEVKAGITNIIRIDPVGTSHVQMYKIVQYFTASKSGERPTD